MRNWIYANTKRVGTLNGFNVYSKFNFLQDSLSISDYYLSSCKGCISIHANLKVCDALKSQEAGDRNGILPKTSEIIKEMFYRRQPSIV